MYKTEYKPRLYKNYGMPRMMQHEHIMQHAFLILWSNIKRHCLQHGIDKCEAQANITVKGTCGQYGIGMTFHISIDKTRTIKNFLYVIRPFTSQNFPKGKRVTIYKVLL